MITLRINSAEVFKELNNTMEYATGFLEGVQRGKKQFLNALGVKAIETLKEFIDSNARVNPQTLHHVYEWYRTGSPDARLFDINYTVSNIGLSFGATFRQSDSVKAGSTVPFYDKARIMEQGIPVTIRPRKANVLAFEDDGETVFTKQPVEVANPGGAAVNRSFERVFDLFFRNYFSQAFLLSSGILARLGTPVAFKRNLAAGARLGRSKGIETGIRWIANTVVD